MIANDVAKPLRMLSAYLTHQGDEKTTGRLNEDRRPDQRRVGVEKSFRFHFIPIRKENGDQSKNRSAKAHLNVSHPNRCVVILENLLEIDARHPTQCT